MRASFWIVCLALCVLLHGCSVIAFGRASSVNKKRQARATTSGVQMAARPPAPGDSLTLLFANGRTVRSGFVSLTADSIYVRSGTFALADIDTVERPWNLTSVSAATLFGAVPDIVSIVLALGFLAEFNASF